MNLDIKTQNGLKTVVAYLVIFNILSALISLLIVFLCKNIGIDINSNHHSISSMINLIVYLILFAVLWFINKKDLVLEVKTFTKSDTKKNIALKVLAAYGIFYAISIVANSLVSNIEFYADFANNVLGRHTQLLKSYMVVDLLQCF